jgi:zinc D-Ala-D-Ala carboxypeptidase
MKVGNHFTLEEFTYSTTALRKSIDNTPGPDELKSMEALCKYVLDPIHDGLHKAVYISSGYRCPELNELVGGAHGSQHVKGQAADISVFGMSTEDLFQWIIRSGIAYDQIIQEFDKWIHISFNPSGIERHEALRAVKENGKNVYKRA